jgi:UDPglucose 6-dehydrogenase
MREVYRPLFLNQSPILFTEPPHRELIKYAANAFLATKITFINEMADLCEKVGADVQDVSRGIGLDNRIGASSSTPAPAMAGAASPRIRSRCSRPPTTMTAPLRIVEAVVQVNDSRKRAMGRKVIDAHGRRSARQDGRAARPDLQAQYRRHARLAVDRGGADAAGCMGVEVAAYDPEGMEQAKPLSDRMSRCATVPMPRSRARMSS